MNKNKDLSNNRDEYYKVTVNDLYFELEKLIENGEGDKPIKLSVTWDNCDHLQNLRAYSTDFKNYLLLMGYE